MSAVVPSLSQRFLDYTVLSTHIYLQMFIAASHWSELRPLASSTSSILDPHQESSWISCCCPVCHGDPAALDLQNQPFQPPQQFIDEVDIGMGQLKVLNMDMGGC